VNRSPFQRPSWLGAAALLACGLMTSCGGPPEGAAKPAGQASKCPDKPPPLDADPRSAGAMEGKVVDRVCVLGASNDGQKAVTKAVATKAGEKVNSDRIRDDIAALVKLNTLDDVSVFAAPSADKDKVLVVFAVKERPRIAEVVFDGAKVLSEQGLTGKVPLEKARPLDKSEVRQLVNMLRDEYAHRGYGGAKIDAAIEPVADGSVRVRFVVSEGPQWKLVKVVFKGAAKVKEADLKKSAELAEGAPFDDEKVEKAMMQLSALYFDKGMLEVRVEPPKKDTTTDGNVTVTFNITEGDVYRVGTIKFAKVEPKQEKELLSKMKTRPKQVFDRSQLLADITKMKDYFKGQNQNVEILPRTELDQKTKTVSLLLDVEEVSAAASAAPPGAAPAAAPR
jgi:outer membrane protein insertion porin family